MERDDGLIYCGDPSDYLAPYRRWPSLEKKAMRYVRGRVLDVGCGAGRVALHLQERGQEGACASNSPLAVEVAKRRGVENAIVLSVVDLDFVPRRVRHDPLRAEQLRPRGRRARGPAAPGRYTGSRPRTAGSSTGQRPSRARRGSGLPGLRQAGRRPGAALPRQVARVRNAVVSLPHVLAGRPRAPDRRNRLARCEVPRGRGASVRGRPRKRAGRSIRLESSWSREA